MNAPKLVFFFILNLLGTRISIAQCPSTSAISGSATVCLGASLPYSVVNVPGSTYDWTITGGYNMNHPLIYRSNAINIYWWPSAGPGTISVVETNAAGCAGSPVTMSVTVEANPSTSSIIGNNYVCENAAGESYSVSGTSGSTYSWTITGGTQASGTSTNSITINWGAPGAATIAVVETTSSGCSGSPVYFSVGVNARPTITVQPSAVSQIVCPGGASPLTITATKDPSSTLSYQWYSNSINSYSGGSAISNATQSSYYPPWSSLPGTLYYYAVVSDSYCGVLTSEVSGAITTLPWTSINTQPSPSAQTVVQNNSISPFSVAATGAGTITYQWYRNSVPIPGATNADYTPSTSQVGTFQYFAQAQGTCPGDPSNFPYISNISSIVNVDVISDPATTITTHPSTVPQTVCPNFPVSPFSVSAAGTSPISYQWFSNNANSNVGGTLITGATNFYYYPPTNAIGTKYYYAVATGAVGSATSSVSGAVTVTSPPSITTHPSLTLQTYCEGGTISPLTVVATGSNLTYQWFSRRTDIVTSPEAISGETNSTYTPSVLGKNVYYVNVNGQCGQVASSESGQITIHTTPTFTTQPSINSMTLCQFGYGSLYSSTQWGLELLPVSFQWYENSVQNNTGGAPIVGATGQSYSLISANSGVKYFYVVAANSCGTTTSSVSGAITFTPNTSIISQPSSIPQTVCQGGIITPLIVESLGTGTLTYQWFVNTASSTYGGSIIEGANNSSYTPSNAVPVTRYYYVTASSDCSSIVSSVSGPITVNASTYFSKNPALNPMTFCQNGASGQLSVNALGTGTVGYQWYSSDINSNSGGTLISGATDKYYSPQTTSIGTKYYYAVATGDCGSATSSVSGPVNVVLTTITTHPSSTPQNVCQTGTATPLTVAGAGVGFMTYQWYINSIESNEGGLAISWGNGAQTNTYSPELYNHVGTYYYYCIITSDCGSAKSLVSGPIKSFSQPVITIHPSTTPQSVCQNSVISPLIVSATGLGTISYQWYDAYQSEINGATNASYTPSTGLLGIKRYFAIATDACSYAFSSYSGNITVNPSTTITLQPSTVSQTVCKNGTTASLSVAATGTGTVTYQWYSNTTNSNIGGSVIGGATLASYSPSSALVGTKYYYATATSSCGTTTSSASGPISIVQTKFITQPTTSQPTTCQYGSTLTLSVVASGAGAITYKWYKNTNSSTAGAVLISGATSSTYAPSTSSTGTQYYLAKATSSCGTVWSNPVQINVIQCSVAITGMAKFCEGSHAELYADTGGRLCNFAWSTGETTASIWVTSPGTYSVTAYDILSGATLGPVNRTVQMTQNTEGASITKSESCLSTSMALTANPSGPYYYEWSTASTGQTVNIGSPGNYTVYIVTGSGPNKVGCIDIFPCFYARVRSEPEKVAIEPVMNSEVDKIMAYPNPVEDNLTVSIPWIADKNVPVSLFDPLGNLVRNENIKKGEWRTEIFTRDFPNGLYLVKVDGGSFLYTTKILIMH